MKIADFSLSMQTSHDWSQQFSVKEKLRVWVDPPAPPPSPSRQVTLSAAAQDAAAIDNAMRDVQNDPKLQLLILLIEKMTGQKVKIFDARQLRGTSSADIPASQAGNQAELPPRVGFGVDYSKVENHSESEQTTMQATGVIKTSDGKEIKFSLNLDMCHQYSETRSTRINWGDAARKTDPLVMNFNGTAAQLSEQRFAFDLNSDGKNEQINVPLSGSGFLALDKNNDGKINNGNELFGPASGNGFNELAQYDSDHNGWIDENDPVFQQLKVWTKNASGSDQLNSLASLGVGAISLHSIATPFDIKTATNRLLGSIQSGSVTLNENGTVGTVQQIDLTV